MDSTEVGITKSCLDVPNSLSDQTCPICSYCTTSQASMICHLTSKHNERLVAVCKVCQQLFSSDVIGSHVLNCKGSYSCLICHSTFALPSYLQRHITRHHKSSQRPICGTCGKDFSSTNALVAHKRLHEETISCKLCKKVFSYQSELERHSIIHSKSSPYRCPFCSRSFTRCNLLKTHILRHTDPSILTCCYCSRTYASRSYLLQHMQRHERELQTPSISSLSTSSFTELDLNTLSDDCETSILNDTSLAKVLEEPVLMDFNYVHSLSPNVNYLHAVLYGQNI